MAVSTLTQKNQMAFSIISRRVDKKNLRVKKFKLKTKKAFIKRFKLVSNPDPVVTIINNIRSIFSN